MYLRSQFPGSLGMVPSFPPYVAPPPPVIPWNQHISQTPGMQVSNVVPNITMQVPPAVVPPQVDLRPVAQVQARSLHYSTSATAQPAYSSQNVHGPVVPPHHYNNMNGSISSGAPDSMTSQNNVNYSAKITLSQQQYAAGQPLYRRAASSTNALPIQSTPSLLPAHDERIISNNQGFAYSDPLHSQQNQPKLTAEELAFISRALEHQASSGEPFSGDLQNLRLKLMQAISSGDISALSRAPQQQQQQQQPLINYAGPLLDHHVSQGYNKGFNTAGSSSVIPPSNVFTPIPHKSPVGPTPPERPVYNNGYPETSPNSRLWPNPNSSFPSLSEGINMHAPVMHSHQNHAPNDRGHLFLEPTRTTYGQQTPGVPLGVMNNVQQVLPRPLCAPNPNNNSLLAYSNNEYGYHSDVGGGLKAQLSGGIRQGFGERSAFSRVNGSHDLDMPDSSGLGRSYANVVKAAVTTAAVGTGVPSTSLSMTSNIPRNQMPPSVPVPSHMYPNAGIAPAKFYSASGAPMQHHYGGAGP